MNTYQENNWYRVRRGAKERVFLGSFFLSMLGMEFDQAWADTNSERTGKEETHMSSLETQASDRLYIPRESQDRGWNVLNSSSRDRNPENRYSALSAEKITEDTFLHFENSLKVANGHVESFSLSSPENHGSSPSTSILQGEETNYLVKSVVRIQFAKSGRKLGDNTWYSCSGSILSDTHILTAAHCLPHGGNQDVSVYTFGESKPKRLRVNAIAHPDYNGSYQLIDETLSPDDDLAILEISSPKTDFPYAQHKSNRMRILSSQFNNTKKLLVRGTGTRVRSHGPNVASNGTVERPANDIPISISGSTQKQWWSVASDKVSVCKGDSGGPAIDIDHHGLPIQAGVHSGFIVKRMRAHYCPNPGKKCFGRN